MFTKPVASALRNSKLVVVGRKTFSHNILSQEFPIPLGRMIHRRYLEQLKSYRLEIHRVNSFIYKRWVPFAEKDTCSVLSSITSVENKHNCSMQHMVTVIRDYIGQDFDFQLHRPVSPIFIRYDRIAHIYEEVIKKTPVSEIKKLLKL
jgi:hypothetical protein